jgi:hypothetical protein
MKKHDIYDEIKLSIEINEDWIDLLKKRLAQTKRENAILRRQLFNRKEYDDE